jgi:hypothetical protein
LELLDSWREQARVVLIVDGAPLGTWPVAEAPGAVRLPSDARWAALAVWEAPGGPDQAWAVTMPVWIRPPGS